MGRRAHLLLLGLAICSCVPLPSAPEDLNADFDYDQYFKKTADTKVIDETGQVVSLFKFSPTKKASGVEKVAQHNTATVESSAEATTVNVALGDQLAAKPVLNKVESSLPAQPADQGSPVAAQPIESHGSTPPTEVHIQAAKPSEASEVPVTVAPLDAVVEQNAPTATATTSAPSDGAAVAAEPHATKEIEKIAAESTGVESQSIIPVESEAAATTESSGWGSFGSDAVESQPEAVSVAPTVAITNDAKSVTQVAQASVVEPADSVLSVSPPSQPPATIETVAQPVVEPAVDVPAVIEPAVVEPAAVETIVPQPAVAVAQPAVVQPAAAVNLTPKPAKKYHNQPIIIVPPSSKSNIVVDHQHGVTTIRVEEDADVVVEDVAHPSEQLLNALSLDEGQIEANPASVIVPVDSAKGTYQGSLNLPRVQHVKEELLEEQNALQVSAELGLARSTEGTVRPITEHIQGQMLSTLRQEQEAESTRQDEYNADPWAAYGGERSLFCRIQYYHDTVEFSPQCELVDYNLVDPEYHKSHYNCQFFEQRGILYFYGERWIDCTPLSQRGKKVVFECGVSCAQREGQAQPL